MSWLQLEVLATPATVEELEEKLFNHGAVSVSLVSESDEPVLEPAPGETPLWSAIRIQALFSLDLDLKAIAAELGASVDVRFVGETDWQAYARTFAVDTVFADRIHLRPPLEQGESYNDERYLPLYLEPGLAFGSGSHPTTRLCLEWLATHVQRGDQVLDFGCGSGVLAICAARLGAAVVAVDYDEQAVAATIENSARNGVQDQVKVLSLEMWQANPLTNFNVVVANILAEPLRELAHPLTDALAPEGSIVLAGLLNEQADHVKSAYPEAIRFGVGHQADGWSLLIGSKQTETSREQM